MRCPEIISFHNGVIEWNAEPGISLFSVEINGQIIADGNDGFYRAKTIELDVTRDAEIKITAVDKKRATVTLLYSAKDGALTLAPIFEFKLSGERIEWCGIAGVSEYRVYDIDRNVATTARCFYDMTARSIVRCVCPVPNMPFLKEASPPSGGVRIPYLRGNGTADSPYLIGTPFELRAVDYYESECAPGTVNHYCIERDIDYRAVGIPDDESNILSLRKPFFGVLDGCGNRLMYIRVRYNGGYWALFDYIARGGCVKNIVFESADIYNAARDDIHPINCVTATVAYINNGEISNIELDGVRVTASGGGVCGIVVHNSGVVRGCTVRGAFVQDVTAGLGTASYEISGIVLENRSGGIVTNNTVHDIALRGTGDNIRAAAGVVSVNRTGGTVTCNAFGNINVTGLAAGTECGGIVAYSSGVVERGGGYLGVLVVNGGYVDFDVGGGCGKLVGKNDGDIS